MANEHCRINIFYYKLILHIPFTKVQRTISEFPTYIYIPTIYINITYLYIKTIKPQIKEVYTLR